MKDLTSRKWHGIISLAWFLLGFALLMLGEFTKLPESLGIWCFLLWCAGTLLFALSGLRSKHSINIWCSAFAISFLILFLYHMRPRIGHGRPMIIAAQTDLANFKVALDSFRTDTALRHQRAPRARHRSHRHHQLARPLLE